MLLFKTVRNFTVNLKKGEHILVRPISFRSTGLGRAHSSLKLKQYASGVLEVLL